MALSGPVEAFNHFFNSLRIVENDAVGDIFVGLHDQFWTNCWFGCNGGEVEPTTRILERAGFEHVQCLSIADSGGVIGVIMAKQVDGAVRVFAIVRVFNDG